MFSRTLFVVVSLALSLLAAPISDPNAVDVGAWSVPAIQHESDLKTVIEPSASTHDHTMAPDAVSEALATRQILGYSDRRGRSSTREAAAGSLENEGNKDRTKEAPDHCSILLEVADVPSSQDADNIETGTNIAGELDRSIDLLDTDNNKRGLGRDRGCNSRRRSLIARALGDLKRVRVDSRFGVRQAYHLNRDNDRREAYEFDGKDRRREAYEFDGKDRRREAYEFDGKDRRREAYEFDGKDRR